MSLNFGLPSSWIWNPFTVTFLRSVIYTIYPAPLLSRHFPNREKDYLFLSGSIHVAGFKSTHPGIRVESKGDAEAESLFDTELSMNDDACREKMQGMSSHSSNTIREPIYYKRSEIWEWHPYHSHTLVRYVSVPSSFIKCAYNDLETWRSISSKHTPSVTTAFADPANSMRNLFIVARASYRSTV